MLPAQGFANAVFGRLNLLEGGAGKVAAPPGTTFQYLQDEIGFDLNVAVDPATFQPWNIQDLLLAASDRSTWLGPGAPGDALQRQIEQVLALMVWRSGAEVGEGVTGESTEGRQTFGHAANCPLGPHGYTPPPALRATWAQLFSEALASGTTFGGGVLGTDIGWGPQSANVDGKEIPGPVASVLVDRDLWRLKLITTSPLRGVPVDEVRLMFPETQASDLGSSNTGIFSVDDLQRLAAVGLPVAADRQIGVGDFDFSGRPLGYLGPNHVAGAGAFDAVFDVPPALVLQPRANKTVQLLYPGLLLRVNMQEPPIGFPPASALGGECYWAAFAYLSPPTLIYREALPPLAPVTTANTLGVDWTMPMRLTPALEETWGKVYPYGLPPETYVNPLGWKVNLFVTAHGKPFCPAGFTYRWHVEGEGLSGGFFGTGCRVDETLGKLGVYNITATQLKDGVPTGTVAGNSRVVVRDWLIVALGDSNGSGEGNPPWVFPQCDRSLASSQYQTAQRIEEVDPRSSVTLLFASCSGARTSHLWADEYKGIEKGYPLPPQIEQVEKVLGERKVDAVILSVGINDLYFGPLVKYCLTALGACQDRGVKLSMDAKGDFSYSSRPGFPTLADQTALDVRGLHLDYSDLARSLVAKLHPAHVFITQYPDLSHDQNGRLCTDEYRGPYLHESTWEWLAQTGQALDAVVAATSKLGWTPVTGIPEDFFTHGYCSTTSYFVPIIGAVDNDNPDGAFHPNVEGQEVTFKHTLEFVCNSLYGNRACTGIPAFR